MSEFQIIRFSLVTSTQEVAGSIMRPNIVVLAEAQTRGRGRRGREWLSPPGGLWFTVILHTPISPNLVSLGAGAAVTRALRAMGYEVCLKWPNDIIFQGKKLGGIIGERVGDLTLLGVGINLRNEVPEELNAASLPQVDREPLLLSILEFLKDSIENAIPLWREFQCTLGRMVDVDGKVGLAREIDEDGFLLLETEKGIERIATGTLRFLENL